MVNVSSNAGEIAPSYSPAPASTNIAALSLVTALFFLWGFVTVLNDILIPHLKSIFDLNYAKVMLIQFAFFSAYFIFSIPSAKLVDAIGYKKTMVTGLFTTGVGALLFIPAASVASFPLFLIALMTLAAGITALQVTANPYVTVLGPPETASSRLNLTQAFNSLGTTIGPRLGGLLILSANFKSAGETRQMSAGVLQAYRVQEAASVKLPYLVIGLALIIFGLVIAMFKLPDVPGAARHEGSGVKASLWKYRQLVFGTIGIFVYVGAEVSIGSFLINYFGQPEIGSLPEFAAAKYVTYYWGGAMVGRFIGSAILQKVKTGTVLPSIFTLGIAELGPLTGDGSGMLVMAIVGGAILPVLQGALADRIGIHHAFIIPAICYIYILYYALWGSRPTPVVVAQ